MKIASRRVVTGIILMVIIQGMMPHTVSYAQEIRSGQEREELSLPVGKVGQSYEYQMRVEGGWPPFKWRLVSGELPPGISLEASGRLGGLPNTARREAYSFVVEVTDSSQPSQRAEQLYSFKVAAAPLRIVDGTNKLTIVSPATTAQDKSGPVNEYNSSKAALLPSERSSEPRVRNPATNFTWPIVVPKPAPTYRAEMMRAYPSSTENDDSDKQGNNPAPPTGKTSALVTGQDLNPAFFIKIYEVPKARSGTFQKTSTLKAGEDAKIFGKLIYDGRTEGLNSTRLTADESSTIVIVPDVHGRDIAFNTIYMAAELSSGDNKQNLEVINYSEVGTAPSDNAFIIGASFETARNIIYKLITLQRRSTDVLKYSLKYYKLGEIPPKTGPDRDGVTQNGLDEIIDIDKLRTNQALLDRARESFKQFGPEINSIAGYLVTETNRNIVERVANNLFHLDRDILIAISKQFSNDVELLDSADKDIQNLAIRRLLYRTLQLYKDFQPARAEIIDIASNGPLNESETAEKGQLYKRLAEMRKRIEKLANDESKLPIGDKSREQISLLKDGLTLEALKIARDIYAFDRSNEAITNLRDTKFPNGWVSLDEARAQDGDTLKLTIRVQNPANAGTGNKVPFYIAVKKYGVKLHWASSFMFIKRVGITDEDLTPDEDGNALSAVNFAPSPGVSYGFTYFKRGDTGGSKFLRALAPTVGINVSFMNFNDPGFDLQTGMFTNTTGTDVQVGAGPIVSLFNNKLHFIPVGWNLNANEKRKYWGVGFGFIEIAKELGKYLKSAGNGSTQ
jgi:hypothetical protein